ncbi:hypothetical protein RGQ29_016338 [Quercus rubra]|uniref:Transmembrane protein n=1 Tax=Quercus rubra TaxID=3512 RepID=A0AAN7FIV7_QUERU|nr:hypothetical protein RGQ29_016338 [Quercus rubra]
MAQEITFKALAIVFAIVAIFSSSVMAQDFAPAAAPTPAIEKGAAYSNAVSGAMIFGSLVLSMLAMLKH